jgi:hypothetical protein
MASTSEMSVKFDETPVMKQLSGYSFRERECTEPGDLP